MASLESTNPADAAPYPLAPTQVDDILSAKCTYLKYRSNPDKPNKKKDVTKGGVRSGVEIQDAEYHAEIKMLNKIYAPKERSRQTLQQLEEEPLKEELAQLKIDLQEIKTEAKEELIEINQTEKNREEKEKLKETNQTKKVRKAREKWKELKEIEEEMKRESTRTEKRKEELKEITEQRNEAREKLTTRTETREEMRAEEGLKKITLTNKRKKCEKKWTKIINEKETQIGGKDNALTLLKQYIDNGNVSDLRKYIHSNTRESWLSKVKQELPGVFWVSKSPCEICAQELIRAYKDRNKPTIYIAGVYEEKDENLTELHRARFQFKPWDLYREYDDWKKQFEHSEQFKGYQKIHDKTREALDQLKTQLPF